MSREASRENPALQRIPELDGLRGIAIATVVYFHFVIGRGLALPYPLDWVNRTIGQTFCGGVDLFFVLSGFLIGGILLDAKESDDYFRIFYTRRAFRILPIYVFLMGGFSLAWFVLGRDFHLFKNLTIGNVFNPPMPWYVYLTFTENIFLGVKQSWAYFCSPSWSLAVEEQFYLTLPLLIRFLPRRWIGPVIAFFTIACISVRSFLAVTDKINWVQFFTLPFCRGGDTLLIGVGCALIVRNERIRGLLVRKPVILHLLAVLFGGLSWYQLAGRWTSQSMGRLSADYTLWALFFGSILLIGVLNPSSWVCKPLRFKPLMGLGTIAYCLYLIHDSVRDAVTAVANMHGDPGIRGTWLSIVAGIAISIGLASFSWFVFEKRFIRFGRRFSSPSEAHPKSNIRVAVPQEEAAASEV